MELIKSATFDAWLHGPRDARAKARIAARLDRVADRNFGDVKSAGCGLSERRIDQGPRYRDYFLQRGPLLVVVLASGDKRTQRIDIKTAQRIATVWERES